MRLQLVPHCNNYIFGCRQYTLHKGDVQVEVLVIAMLDKVIFNNGAQYLEVHNITGILVRLAFYGDKQHIIMPMPVRVRALAEYFKILLIAPGRIINLVRCIERFPAGNIHGSHAANILTLWGVLSTLYLLACTEYNVLGTKYTHKDSMRILIVSATPFEIASLADAMQPAGAATGKLRSFDFNGLQIDMLTTGIGMTATAFSLGKTLPSGYDLAINLGIAGSFDRSLKLGDVVNVTTEQFSELGAEDGDEFLTLAELNLPDDNAFLFANGELRSEPVTGNAAIDRLPKVKGITVNKVHGNEASISRTVERFNPQVESMEGASFIYCCRLEKIPCVQVRAISNYVERRNKEAWNIQLALSSLNEKALEIIKSLA